MEPITGLFSINNAFPHPKQANRHEQTTNEQAHTKISQKGSRTQSVKNFEINSAWDLKRKGLLKERCCLPWKVKVKCKLKIWNQTQIWALFSWTIGRIQIAFAKNLLYARKNSGLVGLLQKVNQSGPSESLAWLIFELYGTCRAGFDHNNARPQSMHPFILLLHESALVDFSDKFVHIHSCKKSDFASVNQNFPEQFSEFP